uniref:cellulase n=1 Tax=Kalanchoe fedtschenkoi TaxID=63787 RepID=A0A7N1A8Q3_KALFE
MTIHGRENLTATIAVAALALFGGLFISVDGTFDYKDALTKSIIFLETQRSGKLPPNHRPAWREDSGLQDGKLMSVDLVGGYYDAGDNVKYGFPMSFTVTTLAWNAIFYKSELQAAGELGNAEAGIRWGTDFFLKAAAKKNKLYVQVGDPVLDHQCWVRPEIMETPRTVLMIDENTPGTEIAAETSAAMASASMVFRATDKAYSRRLLNKAKLVSQIILPPCYSVQHLRHFFSEHLSVASLWQLFQFAKDHKGTYDGECPFYCSFSGYNDELLWAATWLYMATKRQVYLQYITEEAISANVNEFSWDLKYAGAQILLSKVSQPNCSSPVNLTH